MRDEKVRQFIELAGQSPARFLDERSAELRALGAQLLLSEVLEYIVNGLGVIPEYKGVKLSEPNALSYREGESKPSHVEMVDGLCDTAYTMFWNAIMFGIPLEKAFDLVCDNNLEKFVRLDDWRGGEGELPIAEWDLNRGIEWPKEVASVTVVRSSGLYFGVGRDVTGKVRKPSSYEPLRLDAFVAERGVTGEQAGCSVDPSITDR